MGDYKNDQKKLQQLWDELLSDEEDEPIQNNDSSDEYCPPSDVSNWDSSSEEDKTTLLPKRKKFRGHQDEHILDFRRQ